MTGHWRALAAAVLAASPVLTGCAGAGGPFDSDRPARASSCFPSRISAEPASVPAGRQVRLVAAPFACPSSYPAGKTYSLEAWADVEGPVPSGGREPRSLGTVPVGQDGSLDAVVGLPGDLPPGRASIQVLGSADDEPCDDTAGSSGSCAIYQVDLDVLPS